MKLAFYIVAFLWCPSSSKHNSPAALTSHIMKTVERVLDQLRTMVRPPPVCLPASMIPISTCSTTALCFCCVLLQYVLGYPFSSTGWEADSNVSGYLCCFLECWQSDSQTTVYAPAALHVRQCGQQHWGPIGNCLFSLPHHPQHNTWSPAIFRNFWCCCHSWQLYLG